MISYIYTFIYNYVKGYFVDLSSDIPKGGENVPIQGKCGFNLPCKLKFIQSAEYKDLWEPSCRNTPDCIEIQEKTHVAVVRLFYKNGRYWVLAKLDQHPQFFDITRLFRILRPLILKEKGDKIWKC
jgi:hypothetical protein